MIYNVSKPQKSPISFSEDEERRCSRAENVESGKLLAELISESDASRRLVIQLKFAFDVGTNLELYRPVLLPDIHSMISKCQKEATDGESAIKSAHSIWFSIATKQIDANLMRCKTLLWALEIFYSVPQEQRDQAMRDRVEEIRKHLREWFGISGVQFSFDKDDSVSNRNIAREKCAHDATQSMRGEMIDIILETIRGMTPSKIAEFKYKKQQEKKYAEAAE